jgi:hypothetical protein
MSFLIAGTAFYKDVASLQIGDRLELVDYHTRIAVMHDKELCGFVPSGHTISLPSSVTIIDKIPMTKYFPIVYSIRVHLNPS